jgi:hypothetical protein
MILLIQGYTILVVSSLLFFFIRADFNDTIIEDQYFEQKLDHFNNSNSQTWQQVKSKLVEKKT